MTPSEESPRPVNLVVLQVELQAEAYASPAAFRAWVRGLCEDAVGGLSPAPTLLAFPEAIGLPLLLEGAGDLRAYLRRHGPGLLGALLRRPWGGLAASFLPQALAAYQAYRSAFAEAARTFGVTVVAGSAFLPDYDEEGLRGTHLRGRRFFNQSFTFAPTGTLLGAARKARLTPGLESRLGLARGGLEDARPLHTPVGRVGVAICLDAFFDSVVSRFDGLGTQILVQPSANFAAWDGPWSGARGLSEGEAWLRYGLRAQLQERLNLVYGLNPMLVGELWGLRAEGRSSMVVNRRFHAEAGLEGQPGLLALAARPDRSEVLRAALELPPAADAPFGGGRALG